MPTRLDFDFNRSVARLDTSAAQSGIFTPEIASIEINGAALVRFNAVAASLAPGIKPMDLEQIAGVCRRVLRAAAKGAQSPFVKVRLRRAAEMRAALADPGWSIEAPACDRVRELVAYMDDPAGLLPNDAPMIGRLDEALLVDMAMDGLRAELDDYADFCRYRQSETLRQGATPDGAGIDRAQWFQEREQERRLEQQLRRVRGSTYASGSIEKAFRVC